MKLYLFKKKQLRGHRFTCSSLQVKVSQVGLPVSSLRGVIRCIFIKQYLESTSL